MRGQGLIVRRTHRARLLNHWLDIRPCVAGETIGKETGRHCASFGEVAIICNETAENPFVICVKTTAIAFLFFKVCLVTTRVKILDLYYYVDLEKQMRK